MTRLRGERVPDHVLYDELSVSGYDLDHVEPAGDVRQSVLAEVMLGGRDELAHLGGRNRLRRGAVSAGSLAADFHKDQAVAFVGHEVDLAEAAPIVGRDDPVAAPA